MDLYEKWLSAALVAVVIAVSTPAARADLPSPTRFGVAVEMGDLRAVKAWLDEGLPADFTADRIGTGLMIAAWEGNIPMMELFISRGADINRANAVREQALMHAAWKGNMDAVRLLLDRGARIDRDGMEWSALHYAAFAGHDSVARLLLDRGANINARTPNGSSALMMAAREGHEKAAGMLVERGADLEITSDWGDDVVSFAMRYGHVRIARLATKPEKFAEIARKPPESFPLPTRSVPMPENLDALLREMRHAQAEGRPTDDLQERYINALAELEKDYASTAQAPARPAPESLDALIREMRRAQAEGRPIDDLQKRYLESLAAQEKDYPPAAQVPRRQGPPRALEIRAKRGEPGQEKAQLIYDAPSAPAVPAGRINEVPGADGP